MLFKTSLSLCVALTSCLAYAAPELTSTLKDQQEVAVTIYNDNLALVKDTRKVALFNGEGRLAWRDVSARMQPDTALLRNLSHGKGFYLIEQNFDFDLLTPRTLLDKYVGQKVTVIRSNPASGAETQESATVLATNDGVVLQYADRIETGVPGRLAFNSVPDTLRDRPTLVMSLNSPQQAEDVLELSYLTGGLVWQASYVAELGKNDDVLDLNAWVTLTNSSGAAFNNARLQLVAGDVNQVRGDMVSAAREERMPKALAMAAPKMAEESLFEYHLYTLDRPTSIADKQTKQVALLSANNVAAHKEYVLRGADYYYRASYGDLGQKMKVGVFITFANKGGSLGVPLPRGIVRVYKKDRAGNAQFVGEDRIDHTPENEKIRLKLGDAFDVTADKKQSSFDKVGGSGKYNYIFEAAYEVLLKNAKSEAVTVKVVEPIPGDWQMLSESAAHQQEAANTAVWQVAVPAKGETKLSYKVRVRY